MFICYINNAGASKDGGNVGSFEMCPLVMFSTPYVLAYNSHNTLKLTICVKLTLSCMNSLQATSDPTVGRII